MRQAHIQKLFNPDANVVYNRNVRAEPGRHCILRLNKKDQNESAL